MPKPVAACQLRDQDASASGIRVEMDVSELDEPAPAAHTAPARPHQSYRLSLCSFCMQVAHIWKSQGHLAPFLATNVQAAEAQIDVEMGFPAALAEVCYLSGQFSCRGFQS